MADTQTLDWGSAEIPVENVTEEAVKSAESMGGMLPPGKYLCVVTDTELKEAALKAYTTFAVKLKLKVERAVEVEGLVAGKAYDAAVMASYTGKTITDDVILHHPAEKPGMRNRRILVAVRTGTIPNAGTVLQKSHWQTGIIGKRALVTLEKDTYKDKHGNIKETVCVAFDGYDYADKAAAGTAAGDAFDDI